MTRPGLAGLNRSVLVSQSIRGGTLQTETTGRAVWRTSLCIQCPHNGGCL